MEQVYLILGETAAQEKQICINIYVLYLYMYWPVHVIIYYDVKKPQKIIISGDTYIYIRFFDLDYYHGANLSSFPNC